MEHRIRIFSLAIVGGILLLATAGSAAGDEYRGLKEINPPALPDDGRVLAIVGARLIDGRGGPPIADSAVVVRGAKIIAAGPRGEVGIPEEAVIHDASGRSLVPGLVDTHYHNDFEGEPTDVPYLVLTRGVTTLRDPSLPIGDYQSIRASKRPMPRCFLTGRHFDQEPHAHPHDAETIRDEEGARAAVLRHLAEGASAIKVYFRLPPDLIRVTCDEAHRRGVPVTAHLELVDADEAIEAGLDGIEHVTSLGTALAATEAAERFRKAVRERNAARNDERYRLWAGLDLDEEARVRPLIDRMLARRVVLSPTLAVFERRPGDAKVEDHHVRGFLKMLRFVGLCHEAGVPIVVGSHASVPHAERGRAYQREMELLVESGLSPAEVLASATLQGARFLGSADRLGSIEPGKAADLVLIQGDPTTRIQAMRDVSAVILNGEWIVGEPKSPGIR